MIYGGLMNGSKRKTIVLHFLFCISLILTCQGLFAQGITIDHNCTDLSQIPSEWIEAVFDGAKLHYGHTSHGSQLTTGLLLIETGDSFYSVALGGSLPTESGAFCIKDVSRNPTTYFQYVQNELNSNTDINMSMFGWCSELNSYSEAETQAYLDAMAALETSNPDVTFIYTTGNAQANGSSGYNRFLRNNQIRQYCQLNNKILYDFADLDAWYNGSQNTYIYSSTEVPLEHDQYDGDEAGHTTYESCENKGKAVWWMMARLMGWGDSQHLSEGLLSPDEGYYGTKYSFDVYYYDISGLAPAAVFVNIDSSDYLMSLHSGAADDGLYRYKTRNIEADVPHTFYFHAVDGDTGTHRFPASGTLDGPVNNSPELFISGIPTPGEWMTAEVWGVPNGLWAVAASSEPGPLYIAPADLVMDIGPGDLHIIKKMSRKPVHLDAFGYGTKDFPILPGTPSGLRYIQALTKVNAYWAKSNQESFYVGPVGGKSSGRAP